jgi:hypothetical protein
VLLLIAAIATLVDPATFVGNVYGYAPPGATVVIWDGDRAVRSGVADADGSFLINNVPAPDEGKTYTIRSGASQLTAHVYPGAVMALEVDFRADGDPRSIYRHEKNEGPPRSTIEDAIFSKSIFATREGLVGGTTANGHIIVVNDHFAALPSRRALSTNFGHEREVRLTYGSRTVTVPVWDVGPWNTKDDYWNPTSIRETFKDLPRGMPESEAAFTTGYNTGLDERGRRVLNPAGIDLADGTFREDLVLPTNDRVLVEYLWLDSTGPVTATATTSLGALGIVIEAQATDNPTGNSPLDAAEMFVDTIGENGSGIALTPVDGTFDSASERVRGVLDAIPAGPHVVYLHARDAYGNWGPLTTVSLTGSGARRRSVGRR